MTEATSWLIRTKDGALLEPLFIDAEQCFPVCPVCLNDDPGLWADDGEADLADYIDCRKCGLDAALVSRADVDHTQNGLPWPPK